MKNNSSKEAQSLTTQDGKPKKTEKSGGHKIRFHENSKLRNSELESAKVPKYKKRKTITPKKSSTRIRKRENM